MAFQVIKTIHGRKYLYEQESFRVGKKVMTRCRCLGAIDPRTGELLKKKSPAKPKKVHHSRSKSHRPKRKGGAENHTMKLAQLFVTGKLKKYYISGHALSRRYSQLSNRMKTKKGIDLSLCPQIVLGITGSGYIKSIYKAKKNQVIVSYPKTGANKGEYRREAIRAFGRNALEAMRTQNPQQYQRLTLQFDESFKNTTQLVSRFVLLGNDHGKEAKVLAFRFFGNVAQMERNILDPERVGLTDFRKRKHWSDEALSIYAKMEQKGAGEYLEERKKHFFMARSYLRKTESEYFSMNKFNPRRKVARKNWKRAQLRFESQKEMQTKIHLVKQTFF